MQARLVLIRHGETDDNRRWVFQGQSGAGLNAQGRDQATRLAVRLLGIGARFDAVYSSDLERAVETARILTQNLGGEGRADKELREVYLGGWQGKGRLEVQAAYPDEWAAWERGIDVKRGGGESYAELGLRMETAAERIVKAHPKGTVAVVSHGASIKVLVARALGVERLTSFRGVANTAVSVLEKDDEGRWHLALYNDTAHLGDPLAQALAVAM